jgi:hypothetical protein
MYFEKVYNLSFIFSLNNQNASSSNNNYNTLFRLQRNQSDDAVNKVVFVQKKVEIIFRNFLRIVDEKEVGIKFWKEKLHFLSGSLVGIGTVSRISGVGQSYLTSDCLGIGESAPEHFGRTHQRSPLLENKTEIQFKLMTMFPKLTIFYN